MTNLLKSWWATLLIVAIILTTQLLHPITASTLNYDPAFIHAGEYWRLITCHFLHLNWNHVWLNLAGYAIITFSFREEIPPTQELVTVLLCGLGVGFGMLFFDPKMYSYVGLSGALHGFLLTHLIRSLHTTRAFSALFIVGVLAKIAWEQSPYSDTSATAELIGGFVAINAHLAGAISGIVLGTIMYFLEPRWRQK